MSRRALILILFVGLAASLLWLPGSGIREASGLPNFTIPSRTPVPSPTSDPPPTAPPQPTEAPPPATATNAPPPTATNTAVPATLIPSPIGGFLPTAVACGAPPTIQARSNVVVRAGPGTDYDNIGSLVYLEVRVIVGRAGNAPWWVIELADGETGWVANDVVWVQGYTGDAPVVAAPEINGQTPTPGAPWRPTAVPNCPTSTATQPAATATTPPTKTTTPAPTATHTAVPQNAAAGLTPTATSVVPSGAAAIAEANADNAAENPPATAVPLDDETASSAAAALPCASAAFGLIVAGFFISRRFW